MGKIQKTHKRTKWKLYFFSHFSTLLSHLLRKSIIAILEKKKKTGRTIMK